MSNERRKRPVYERTRSATLAETKHPLIELGKAAVRHFKSEWRKTGIR